MSYPGSRDNLPPDAARSSRGISANGRRGATPASAESGADRITVLTLRVVAREFPARPSSLPDIRDFLRQQLAAVPLSADQIRALRHRIAEQLLDLAGTSAVIQVSLRIFPDWVEVDVTEDPML